MGKILHINSYYVDTHLYSKIYKNLSDDYEQIVYIPIKKNRNEDNKMSIPNTELVFSKNIEKYHSIFYFNKINVLTADLENKLLFKDIDIVHAHNLFIDGAVALNLKKKYGIRYIVSVRMTDISKQYKYMLHRRNKAKEILGNADHIIFISPIYKDRLYGMMNEKFITSIEDKTSILPNGIDDFWLESSIKPLAYKNGDPFRLIYIGQIIKRKNLDKVLNVIESLNSNGQNISLTVIGGMYPTEEKFFNLMLERMQSLSFVDYKGKIYDHDILRSEIACSHSLIMPSYNELFGLVFLEAISQNTPVIYPKDEGITPYLEHINVGKMVDPNDYNSIKEGIITMIKDYSSFGNISNYADSFKWNKIVNEFKKLYKI